MGVRERVSQWPLTGRDGELEAFAAAWADRRCQGVVIFGPAGVGKSRLAEECLARAVHDGWKGSRASASAAAASVPLGAIAHLLPPGVDLSDPIKGFAAIARTLARPQRARWVLWVDDLHLLDAASAVLLRQLLDARAVRLIATVRAGEPAGDVVDALAGEDTLRRIDLTAFSGEQVERVLRAALGGPVGRHTVHYLYGASGGNAMYLHELVLGALAVGTLASDGEIWELTEDRPVATPRLIELIGARLATASERGRPVLELLALCEPLPLADAEAVGSLQMLADLERTELIRVHRDRRRTTLALAHPLYGEVLRADMPVLRRQALLLQQAARTETHGALRREDPLHIATWQLAATGTADPGLLAQAAGLARAGFDYAQVATLLAAIPAQHHAAATRLLYGESLMQLGKAEDAEIQFAKSQDLSQTDQERLASIRLRTYNLFWIMAKMNEALAVNENAMEHIVGTRERDLLIVNKAAMMVVSGHPSEGLDLMDSVPLGETPGPGDLDLWLFAGTVKPTALAILGRTEIAVQVAQRTYEVHLALQGKSLFHSPAADLICQALALTEAGLLAKARNVAEIGTESLLADRASGSVRSWMALFRARIEWISGHMDTSRRLYAEAATLARNHRNDIAMRLILSGYAASAAIRGELKTAEATLKKLQNYPYMGLLAGEERLGEAWFNASCGNLAQARTVLTQAAGAARDTGHATSEALLLTDVARLGGAENVAARLVELAQICDGSFATARARLVAALATDDPTQLLASAGELETIGADLLAGEAATAAGSALRRAGQSRRASAAAQQAQACAARCEGARTPLLATAQATSALTAREQEVALLAAANAGSKDIAGALHLSVRTVDNHLQHAYTKLGVTTRRELAHALLGRPEVSGHRAN
ncbi:LuxR C-terminal-related transcriptional regulator [Streptomyces sp. NBC_00289]|uniref:LuxR C-terminal-related transcriptional regulator n=1 Tax=Streptomyces sp. NBC_00289 TaxID=2975703 RepID=UPI0032500CC5